MQVITFLVLLFWLGETRVFQTDFQFRLFKFNDGWIYITKMIFEEGTASFSLDTLVQGVPNYPLGHLGVSLVPDTLWQNEHTLQCQSPLPVTFNHTLMPGEHTITNHTIPIVSQTTYYVVLKDCQKLLEREYKTQLTMYVKLTMVNNGSHVGEDEDDQWVVMPLGVLVAVWLVGRLRKEVCSKDGEQDWPKIVLFAGVLSNLVALLCKGLNMAVYHYNGEDSGVLDVLYLTFHACSEAIVVGIVLLIAYGWTIANVSDPEFEQYGCLAIVMAAMNFALTFMNKLNDDNHNKYHMYDSLPGLMMVGFRMLIITLLLIGIYLTWGKSGPKQKRFLWKFSFLSLIYLLSMPILLAVTELIIPEKMQRQFLFLSVEVIKSITNIELTLMITSKNSQYNRVNLRNYSFLPAQEKQF